MASRIFKGQSGEQKQNLGTDTHIYTQCVNRFVWFKYYARTVTAGVFMCVRTLNHGKGKAVKSCLGIVARIWVVLWKFVRGLTGVYISF